MTDDTATTIILLVGSDVALLEGLAQTLAARGYLTAVTGGLQEAREYAAASPPLVAVIERDLAASAAGLVLGIPLTRGGALVAFHQRTDDRAVLAPTVQRAMLADLALPLERNRLLALVQHVEERARATGHHALKESPGQERHSR
jgi:DNA-binding NtrC family response regulator